MEQDDLDAAAEIELQEPSAWSRRQIEEEYSLDGAINLVAHTGDGVVGWCCARLVDAEAELLKISVSRAFRRQTVGSRLLATLTEILVTKGITRLILEVRSQNGPACGFYRRLGFTLVGKRINYYSRPDDDALLFEKDL